jgi:hypothetical protein
MKKYIVAALFTAAVLGFYEIINLNLFHLNLLSKLHDSWFNHFRPSPRVYENILILNIGALDEKEIQEKIDTLLTLNPKAVGINMCDFDGSEQFREHFDKNPKIEFAYCDEVQFRTRLARRIDEGNTVTHFLYDYNFLEVRLTNSYEKLSARNNYAERINYIKPTSFYTGELSDISRYEYLDNVTVLVGYLEYSEEEVYNYEGRRITPMNEWYGYSSISPDMYDIQISANIIAQIERDDFITEVPDAIRIGGILLACVLNVLLITFIRTRWLLVNLIIYIVLYFVFVALAGLAMVHLYNENYFFHLNELQVLLLITSAFTIASVSTAKIQPQRTAKLRN